MTAVSVALVLALVLLLLMKGNGLSPFPAVVAVIFGLVLSATPAGPAINGALDATGGWIWSNGRTL